LGRRGSKRFFFKKKNQKTFDPWRTPPERLSQTSKSFLLLFFKKEVFLAAYLSAGSKERAV
jgi:hypothetical protein